MRTLEKALKVLAIAAAVPALLFWLATLQQPLIDQHEFRQTQTALTALFLNPWQPDLLNYQTPTIGSPWSIPFEFPLYQWLASLLTSLLPLSLSASGRLISILFGLGCLWPSIGMMRQFGFSAAGQRIFVALYLTSSIYLYWNRSFMIESTALFFALMSLFLYCLCREPNARESSNSRLRETGLHAGLASFLVLGLLIKATTLLPVFLLIAADLALRTLQFLRRPERTHQTGRNLLSVAVILIAAFASLRAWTQHADALKQLNPIGQSLTSQALQSWNFGSLSDRFSPELWNGVMIQRMLTPWGALPATVLLALGLLSRSGERQQKLTIWAALFLALAPPLMFTNLHIEHNYYQSANQIYLLLALACSASLLLDSCQRPASRLLVIGLVGLVIMGNVLVFSTSSGYFRDAFAKDSVKLDIGALIQRRTPVQSALVVFGDDWSSAFAFHAQRRALAIPKWSPVSDNRMQVLADAGRWLGGQPLAAVISKEKLTQEEEAMLQRNCAAISLWRFPEWNVYLCEATAALNSPQRPG